MTSDSSRGRTEHRASLAAFVATLRAVPESGWNAPTAPGKWSPAQIAEHLRLTYVVINAELDGGKGLCLRASAWVRLFLRLAYLPGILRTGRLPRPALAPREVRPGAGPYEQEATARALEQVGMAFEEKLATRRDGGAPVLTHHLFGRLTAVQAWRFVAVHNEHHRLQVLARRAPPPDSIKKE